MRLLPTIVCTLSAFTLIGCGNADEQPHAVIGAKTPKQLVSKDVLELPKQERDAWIHGAITMTIQTIAAKENGASTCVMTWYFEYPETHSNIIEAMQTYPNERASSVLYALAGQACESFSN